jgi:hypothetical protein
VTPKGSPSKGSNRRSGARHVTGRDSTKVSQRADRMGMAIRVSRQQPLFRPRDKYRTAPSHAPNCDTESLAECSPPTQIYARPQPESARCGDSGRHYDHAVNEDEVEQALANRGEDRPGTKDSRIAIGQTDAGRYLRVIYVRDPEPDSVFVITAYDLDGKPLKAYRRRIRKK